MEPHQVHSETSQRCLSKGYEYPLMPALNQGAFPKTEKRDSSSPANQVWDTLNGGLKTLGYSRDHRYIQISEEVLVETEMKTEGRPHPKGPDEPQLQTVRPGEICPVVQFFRKSWELDFSTKSLVFSILVLLCFKHRAGQKKHSLTLSLVEHLVAHRPPGTVSWTTPEELSH